MKPAAYDVKPTATDRNSGRCVGSSASSPSSIFRPKGSASLISSGSSSLANAEVPSDRESATVLRAIVLMEQPCSASARHTTTGVPTRVRAPGARDTPRDKQVSIMCGISP